MSLTNGNKQPDRVLFGDVSDIKQRQAPIKDLTQPFLTRNLVDDFPYMSLCTEETQKRFAALQARRRR